MTLDEILGIARKAGCVEDKHYKGEVIFISNDALERFFRMAQASEREVCAKVCDKNSQSTSAEEIRARGQQ